jgi:hypothetical protein
MDFQNWNHRMKLCVRHRPQDYLLDLLEQLQKNQHHQDQWRVSGCG